MAEEAGAAGGVEGFEAGFAGEEVGVDEDDAGGGCDVGGHFGEEFEGGVESPRAGGKEFDDTAGDAVVAALRVPDGVQQGGQVVRPSRRSSPRRRRSLTQRRIRPSSTMAGAAVQWPMHLREALTRSSRSQF